MRAIVSLNSGSSSIKFALYNLERDGAEPLLSAEGKIERIGIAPSLRIRNAAGDTLEERDWPQDATHEDLLEWLLDWVTGHMGQRELVAIGHRVVHGGSEFAAPCRIDDAILKQLDALCPLAPLHQPHNLSAIRAIAAMAPDLAQIACFDTEFHHDRAAVSMRLAIPRELHEQGIRRYGFHGLSYEYIARRLRQVDPELAAGRVIAAHLGNGASLCAMRDGRSVDTTMGFTALDGLMMGTRSGTIDPGVVLHLQTQLGMSTQEVEDLLYHRCGLLGVSGLSSDMRTLTDSPAPEAQEAIELFAWRAAREAGGLVSALGGLDGIVFTAGIGENHTGIRAAICDRLRWLGITIDHDANRANAPLVSAPESRVAVRVIPTDEEGMIALHTLNLISGEAS